MTSRWLFFALAAGLASLSPCSAGQEIRVAAAGSYDATLKLAFSKDGRLLREFREVSSEDADRFARLQAITYLVRSGEVSHVWKLQPNTRFFSASSDGRKAIVYVNAPGPEEPGQVFLLDAETGGIQDIPPAWFEGDPRRAATISGDGRLIATYSESASGDAPMIVSIYNLLTQKLVTTQTSGFFSAGGIFGGGVTEDGKIEFLNNRVGSKIVDPKTGRTLAEFGPSSVRSPNGKWVVELAGYLHGRERLDTTVVSGLDGKTLGKLSLDISNQPAVSWSGAFCGTSGKMIAWEQDSVLAFDLHSLKQIASFPVETWRDRSTADNPSMSVGCSWDGKLVAIRSGGRLTLHHLK